jgi:transposase
MRMSGKLRRRSNVLNAAGERISTNVSNAFVYLSGRNGMPQGVSGLTAQWMRRIQPYTIADLDTIVAHKRDTKAERLKQQGALNRHPEGVRAPLFHSHGFFDARDLVQLKYEMLRQVRVEGAKKAAAAASFGLSRPTFYQAEAAFAQQGLAGLLPQPRGPKTPHKLTAEVMAFIAARMSGERPPGASALAQAIESELGVSVHPRSVERALARKKKR